MQDDDTTTTWTPRQKVVLDAALALLVETGAGITMTAVARRASCSKETLYKWFGGRDGLLKAMVRRQASRVRVSPVGRERLDLAALAGSLRQYASDWLEVISSDTSLALNRLAISHAGTGGAGLGDIVLEYGRFSLARRLGPVIEAGRDAGILAFDDAETVFRTFFGLVARDVQIRLLLGDRRKPTTAEINRDSARATEQFIALYETKAAGGSARANTTGKE